MTDFNNIYIPWSERAGTFVAFAFALTVDIQVAGRSEVTIVTRRDPSLSVEQPMLRYARMPLRLPPRLLQSHHVRPLNSPLFSYRSLSTSRPAGTSPSHHHRHDHITHIDARSPPKLGAEVLTTDNEPENLYKGGPGAIDKAVHLFFFTEILRGTRRKGL